MCIPQKALVDAEARLARAAEVPGVAGAVAKLHADAPLIRASMNDPVGFVPGARRSLLATGLRAAEPVPWSEQVRTPARVQINTLGDSIRELRVKIDGLKRTVQEHSELVSITVESFAELMSAAHRSLHPFSEGPLSRHDRTRLLGIKRAAIEELLKGTDSEDLIDFYADYAGRRCCRCRCACRSTVALHGAGALPWG